MTASVPIRSRGRRDRDVILNADAAGDEQEDESVGEAVEVLMAVGFQTGQVAVFNVLGLLEREVVIGSSAVVNVQWVGDMQQPAVLPQRRASAAVENLLAIEQPVLDMLMRNYEDTEEEMNGTVRRNEPTRNVDKSPVPVLQTRNLFSSSPNEIHQAAIPPRNSSLVVGPKGKEASYGSPTRPDRSLNRPRKSYARPRIVTETFKVPETPDPLTSGAPSFSFQSSDSLDFVARDFGRMQEIRESSNSRGHGPLPASPSHPRSSGRSTATQRTLLPGDESEENSDIFLTPLTSQIALSYPPITRPMSFPTPTTLFQQNKTPARRVSFYTDGSSCSPPPIPAKSPLRGASFLRRSSPKVEEWENFSSTSVGSGSPGRFAMFDGVDDNGLSSESLDNDVPDQETEHLRKETQLLRKEMAKLRDDLRKLREDVGALKLKATGSLGPRI